MKRKLYVLVGLPGAGKTTWAREYAKDKPNTTVVNLDQIREEWYGDESAQGYSDRVFGEGCRRMKESFSKNEDVIFDSTNLTRRNRELLLDEVDLDEVDCYCIIFPQTFETLIRRNKQRARCVPEGVIKGWMCKFETPLITEGFKEIKIMLPEETIDLFGSIEEYRFLYSSLSVEGYLYTAYGYYPTTERDYLKLKFAMMFYKVGKNFTETYSEELGCNTYYHYENYGAYLMLLQKWELFSAEDILDISAMVCYHTFPIFAQSEYAKRKWRRRLGQKTYDNIMTIYKYNKFIRKKRKE